MLVGYNFVGDMIVIIFVGVGVLVVGLVLLNKVKVFIVFEDICLVFLFNFRFIGKVDEEDVVNKEDNLWVDKVWDCVIFFKVCVVLIWEMSVVWVMLSFLIFCI